MITSLLRACRGGRFRRRHAIPDPRLRPVRFHSADGTPLAGWYGTPRGAAATIILCHGAPGDKRDMAGLGRALMDAGFAVLAFDFRSWGESGGARITFGHREADDVVGAVVFVKREGGRDHRIGAVGLSMGAAAVIFAAARTPDIAALVADSSYARLDKAVRGVLRRAGPFASPAWRHAAWIGERLIGTRLASVAPIEAIASIAPRPVLIIHGRRDRLTAVEDARALHRACGEPKDLWVIGAAGHARTRRIGMDVYDRRIAAFFRRHLPPAA